MKPPRDKRRPERHDRRRLLREIEEREARRERRSWLELREPETDQELVAESPVSQFQGV